MRRTFKLDVEVTVEISEQDPMDSAELADRIRDGLFVLIPARVDGEVVVMTVAAAP